MKDIYTKIDELSEILNSRECISKIKEIETKMENDPSVISLVMEFEKAQRDYSSSLITTKKILRRFLDIKKYFMKRN